MMNTYLFYDIETTGLNKAFDQVLQFAAIRTDLQLKQVENYNICIKLRPDVIPSPRAIMTNRISVTEFSSGLCEYEGIQQIHTLMNTAGTVSIGYNTLGFDDEFLRFSFHRNLLPPYTHQYYNGCYRMDLLPITILFWLYKRDILNWPEASGKPSLKLENIGAANELIKGQAHDAIVDVGATVELAHIFFAAKEMWQYAQGYFNKETDAQRIEEIPVSFQSAAGAHRKALLVNSEYGPKQLYQVPVISIGTSIPYSNQTLWMRVDLPNLKETVLGSVEETTWVIRKKYGEPGVLLPPLERYWNKLDPDRRTLVEENIDWLQSNPETFQQIIRYYREFRYPYIPNLDADAALYQIGFFTRSDDRLCRRFQQAALEEKVALVNQFAGDDAGTLANRILWRNFHEQLAETFSRQMKDYLRQVNPSKQEDALIDYKGEHRTTPRGALAEIDQLRKSPDLDASQHQLLEELEMYLRRRFPTP
jgi:exodeoxyribonuclease-1